MVRIPSSDALRGLRLVIQNIPTSEQMPTVLTLHAVGLGAGQGSPNWAAGSAPNLQRLRCEEGGAHRPGDQKIPGKISRGWHWGGGGWSSQTPLKVY